MGLISNAIKAVAPVHAARREAELRKCEAERASAELEIARSNAAAAVITNYGYSNGGASRSKNSMKGWNSDSASPQADIDRNLSTLRERSRDLYYNAPIAASAINRNVVHVVGSGLRIAPKIAWRKLGITKEQADQMAADIKFEFNTWASSKYCDVSAQNNFLELQQLALRTWLIGGESFALPAYIDHGGRFELCMRLVEGDLCVNPNTQGTTCPVESKNSENGNRIVNGIEIDGNGRVVAYHFVSEYKDSLRKRDWVRIPAYGKETNNPNVLHIFNAIRPGQYRGVPYLAPVIDTIKQLTRYTDAEIMAAVINGLFSVFITTEEAEEPELASAFDEEAAGNGDLPDDDELTLGNGNIGFLKPGEKVEVVDAKRPNTSFDSFTSGMAKQIGAALNIPSELLLMQFTSSYSASRGALLEAWNFFTMNREWFAADFCQPIYELWLAEAVSKGYFDMPGFFGDEVTHAAWCGANWTGPAPGQLNPTVEVEAAVKKMESGLSTGEREAMAMNGSDYMENIEQLATERELRITQGLEDQDGKD